MPQRVRLPEADPFPERKARRVFPDRKGGNPARPSVRPQRFPQQVFRFPPRLPARFRRIRRKNPDQEPEGQRRKAFRKQEAFRIPASQTEAAIRAGDEAMEQFKKTLKARAKELNALIEGRGGGKPRMIQGSACASARTIASALEKDFR